MDRKEFIKSTALSVGTLSLVSLSASCENETEKEPPKKISKVVSPIPLPAKVAEIFASKHHRLHHALWHGLRDYWYNTTKVSETAKNEIENLNWHPPRPSAKWHYDKGEPVGWTQITTNGSGEDFLFMHREMIRDFDEAMKKESAPPIEGWKLIPEPGLSEKFVVPPTWELPKKYKWLERRFAAIKTDEFYWSRMRWWDRQFHDHSYLRTLTLGQLGSVLETSVHNDMHMRWCSQPFDPQSGKPLLMERDASDISDKWDNVKYDFLGETYSSQVNPIFWRIHKWVDSIIDEWFEAHNSLSQDRIKTKEINGVTWFEVGDWVDIDDPWSYPTEGKHDLETMKKVNMILFPPKGENFIEEEGRGEKPMTWF
ncbi:hypothetical protein ACNR9Q_12865 [Maribacter sp. X9]|uniref:hypothetical protein n=1 Tax=Maribacter sp. X9 TaxID=3402159 RepID=UPI003AF36325